MLTVSKQELEKRLNCNCNAKLMQPSCSPIRSSSCPLKLLFGENTILVPGEKRKRGWGVGTEGRAERLRKTGFFSRVRVCEAEPEDSLLFAKFSAPPSQDKVFLRKQGRVTQRIYVVSISSVDWSSEEALDLISLSLLHTRFALHLLHAILVSRSHPQTEFTSLFHAIKIKKFSFCIAFGL
ncbi:cytokinin response factor 4 [Prunus dulcis]|uniref:Cytokinin response factor 4 n=1 Tax=Prunus dulcis TaxID=3755 RepID=A0A4Y1RIN9_PRUDU|nr:cytokinin response factor 4 [Prunus dulcis]